MVVNNDEVSNAVVQHYALEIIAGINVHSFGFIERHNFIANNPNFFQQFDNDGGEDQFNATDPIYAIHFIRKVIDNVALIRSTNPNYYANGTHKHELYSKAIYNTWSEEVHVTLDLAGLIPGVGAIPDGINAVFYTIEGDYTNAAFSSAALVPIEGQIAIGAKYGMLFLNRAGKVAMTGWHVVIKGGQEIIVFSRNKKVSFRKWWGFPSGTHGHHIIPRATKFSEHPAIQRAARAASNNADEFPFHMHADENGIALTSAQHLPGHANYSNRMFDELNDASNAVNLDDIPAENIARTIREWQSSIRANIEDAIQNGGNLGNVPIPELNFN